MELVRTLLHDGNFFLLQSTLRQVLGIIVVFEHIILRNICSLIVVVIVYMLWIERNVRIYNFMFGSISTLSSHIKGLGAHKLKWWAYKVLWLKFIVQNYLLFSKIFQNLFFRGSFLSVFFRVFGF